MIDCVEYKTVDVASMVPASRLSPIWQFATKFQPPLANGKNVFCNIVVDGKTCSHLMKHTSKNGTGSVTNHLKSKHLDIYNEIMKISAHSTASRTAKGCVLGGKREKAGRSA